MEIIILLRTSAVRILATTLAKSLALIFSILTRAIVTAFIPTVATSYLLSIQKHLSLTQFAILFLYDK